MEAEPWKCLPMDINEMGGVSGIVKMNLSRTQVASSSRQKIRVKGLMKGRGADGTGSADEISTDMKDEGPKILRSYGINGNPFVILSEEEMKDAETDIAGAASGNILDALFDEDDKSTGAGQRKQHGGSVVVTQSSLKGLSNCLGQYMQMMFVVKGSSAKIFDDLCQLFDFYICSVFAGFVPEVTGCRFMFETFFAFAHHFYLSTSTCIYTPGTTTTTSLLHKTKCAPTRHCQGFRGLEELHHQQI